MMVDNKLHVADARRMKVEASILCPSFDQTELRRNLSKESKNVQYCAKIIATLYPTTLVTEGLLYK